RSVLRCFKFDIQSLQKSFGNVMFAVWYNEICLCVMQLFCYRGMDGAKREVSIDLVYMVRQTVWYSNLTPVDASYHVYQVFFGHGNTVRRKNDDLVDRRREYIKSVPMEKIENFL